MTRTDKRQGSAQNEAIAGLKKLLLAPSKNDGDSTPRERAATAFDLYQQAVSSLDALELSTPEDVTLSREAYKTLLANVRKAVAELSFSQHTIALYVKYTKAVEEIRLVCDEVLEEKVQRFEADRHVELERRKFIASLVDEFKRGAQQFCASSEEQHILLSEIYSAISDDVISRIPKEPPAGQLYAARVDKRENAPQFIQRVYAEWLTGSFTRADLRRLDSKADIALRNWERLNGRSSLNLPTVIERNDRMLASQNEDAVSVRKGVNRLRSAAQRRARK